MPETSPLWASLSSRTETNSVLFLMEYQICMLSRLHGTLGRVAGTCVSILSLQNRWGAAAATNTPLPLSEASLATHMGQLSQVDAS